MADVEQLGSAHECFAALLHEIDPRALIRVACAAAGMVVGALAKVRYRNPRLEIPAISKRAHGLIIDLVYTVHARNGRVIEVWIFEPQLSWAPEKARIWALYEVAMDAEFRANARVVVFTPDPELRTRIRDRLLPRMKTQPIIVEPDQIERITDYDDARARPELAILGCLYHSHPPAPIDERIAVFKAAWIAIQSLDERVAQRYSVAVMSLVPAEVIEQGAAQLRASGELDEDRWELFSDSERKGHSFHRGREEGRAEQLRRSIVDVLELRGVDLNREQRGRIGSCEAIDVLERWYEAAKTEPTERLHERFR